MDGVNQEFIKDSLPSLNASMQQCVHCHYVEKLNSKSLDSIDINKPYCHFLMEHIRDCPQCRRIISSDLEKFIAGADLHENPPEGNSSHDSRKTKTYFHCLRVDDFSSSGQQTRYLIESFNEMGLSEWVKE